MEQAQAHAGVAMHFDQHALSLVQRPVGRQVAAVLVAVGIAEHHFLDIAAARDPFAVGRQREGGVHDVARILEIRNRLEQRDDVHRQALFQREEAHFLEEQRDFQQVGHAGGLGDDVVRQRGRAIERVDLRRGAQDRQLALRLLAVGEVQGNQRARRGEFALEQCHARRLVQRQVIGFHADCGKQFRHHRFVHVGVLAQVDGGEMKTEHAQGPLQRLQAHGGELRRAVAGKRIGDDLQVGGERGFIGIGFDGAVRFARRHEAGARTGGCRQPGVNAGERLPVGLVLAVRRGVAGGAREPQQRRRGFHQAQRQGEFGAQRVRLLQVVGEGGARLALHRFAQHFGGDEGIAVAVPADPGAHAQQDRQRPAAERAFHLPVQPRNFGKERQAVEGQRVLDFVDDAQARQADHRRLPEREHARVQPRLDARALAGGQPVAFQFRQGGGDVAFAAEDALPLHLGRMRGEDRHHHGAR